MNREIKFRAWDKENKRMLSDLSLSSLQFYGDSLNDALSHTTIMQFTGLHDKNGKEIYEGDIVKDIGGFNVEVRWENGREGYVPFSTGRGERNPSGCEVIGNIYENPNLLKESE